MGEARRKQQAGTPPGVNTRHSPAYFYGDADPPLTFWRAIWNITRQAALKDHPYFYLLPPRERSNFLLRALHLNCRKLGSHPMHELMFYVKRNPNREPQEFLLVQALADQEVDEFIDVVNKTFADDDYPVRRLDPDWVEPACTIRIPEFPPPALEPAAHG
jgi:hypothetical protein